MQTVTLDEAQKHLAELVREVAKHGEVVITEADEPVAKLVPVSSRPRRDSLRDLKPCSIGAVLRPFPAPDDDLLGEMLAAK